MKTLSRPTRTRLLRIASTLDRMAASIRRYVKERTPRRGPRKVIA